MKEYDKVADRVETLKNMREIALELKEHKSLVSDFPYLDEVISTKAFPIKNKVKNNH